MLLPVTLEIIDVGHSEETTSGDKIRLSGLFRVSITLPATDTVCLASNLHDATSFSTRLQYHHPLRHSLSSTCATIANIPQACELALSD